MTLLVAISAAISVPVHAQERPGLPAECEPLTQLPMTLISGHVTIPASINGKDVTLGIDTGGPFSSLTLAAAHRVGHVGHRDDLRIGDLQLERVYMGWMNSFPGVDGLIAPDVLSKYDAEFDFGGSIFRLFKPHSCADRRTGAYSVIPFTLTRDGHVRVPVTLDGRNTYAILDTGAPISVLSMQDATRMFGLDQDSAGIKAAKTVSGLWSNALLANYTYGIWDYPSKTVSAYTYPFKTITMGAMSVADPPIELSAGRNFLGSDFASLLLGNDVLSHFRLYIAYREQKLYIADAGAH
ncbi:MAG TPA: pepsin/retropepsin-like aspartic protease family protein [Rhizomicrobium sp.]|nr:pepsin/retropepsin-like aspartic protease family protein [Rhizomicrobium sp.]